MSEIVCHREMTSRPEFDSDSPLSKLPQGKRNIILSLDTIHLKYSFICCFSLD
jgi:hypothetical protein